MFRSAEKKIPTRWYVPLGRVQTLIFMVKSGAGPGRVQGGSVYNNKLNNRAKIHQKKDATGHPEAVSISVKVLCVPSPDMLAQEKIRKR
jgi:hypothetical protein